MYGTGFIYYIGAITAGDLMKTRAIENLKKAAATQPPDVQMALVSRCRYADTAAIIGAHTPHPEVRAAAHVRLQDLTNHAAFVVLIRDARTGGPNEG